MDVSSFTAFCGHTTVNIRRQKITGKNGKRTQRIRVSLFSCVAIFCGFLIFSLQIFELFHSQLTNAQYITVDVLKVRRGFRCCAIPTTIAKLMLTFFLTHFGAVHNCLHHSTINKRMKNLPRMHNNILWSFVQILLTPNTRGLRAHIRRCSFDKCNAFLHISSWLWWISAFGSNNPTFCKACKPKSL